MEKIMNKNRRIVLKTSLGLPVIIQTACSSGGSTSDENALSGLDDSEIAPTRPIDDATTTAEEVVEPVEEVVEPVEEVVEPVEEVVETQQCLTATMQVPAGPFYIGGSEERSDLVEIQQIPTVELTLRFIDFESCAPISGLVVDLWHANVRGIYSGTTDETVGNRFSRGRQVTNELGIVLFRTIFPGPADISTYGSLVDTLFPHFRIAAIFSWNRRHQFRISKILREVLMDFRTAIPMFLNSRLLRVVPRKIVLLT